MARSDKIRCMIDSGQTTRDAYLALVLQHILGAFASPPALVAAPPAVSIQRRALDRLVAAKGLKLAVPTPFGQDTNGVEEGRVWPEFALSMAGRARLANARACLERVIADGVAGDVIETGVWRGGASMYMRAVLKAWGDDRRVWVADSFEGLPEPDTENFPADGFPWHEYNHVLGVSEDQVKANFESLGLLDDHVIFLKGFFKDTLPPLTDEKWALIRMDGDMYESTIQALDALYPNLAAGGWLLIDDYGDVDACKEAVTDFRRNHGIKEPIEMADHTGAFWQRAA